MTPGNLETGEMWVMDTYELLIAALLGFLPVSEIRGAIPYVFMVADGSPSLVTGLLISILANLTIPFTAFTLLDLLDHLIKSKYTPRFIREIYAWILAFGRRRAIRLRRESYIALALFVGIPLPFTGAWTGSLVAYVLGLDRKKSTLSIEIGVLMASIIVLSVVYTGIGVYRSLFTR